MKITIPISKCPITGLDRQVNLIDINGVPVDVLFNAATGKASFDKLNTFLDLIKSVRPINIPDKTLFLNYIADYLDAKGNVIDLVRLNSYKCVLSVDNTTFVYVANGSIVTDPNVISNPVNHTNGLMAGEYDFFYGAILQGADPLQLIEGGTINADKQVQRFDI